MSNLNFKKKSGQALIEVMVAVGILTVGFLGIVGLLSRALSLNRVVADNYTGTYLAAEGIEITKNIIDSNRLRGLGWNDGLSACIGNGCEVDHFSLTLAAYTDRKLFFNPSSHLYDYSGSEQSLFKRRITTELIGQNEIKVVSTVSWISRGGGTSQVVLEDHFFNWR